MGSPHHCLESNDTLCLQPPLVFINGHPALSHIYRLWILLRAHWLRVSHHLCPAEPNMTLTAHHAGLELAAGKDIHIHLLKGKCKALSLCMPALTMRRPGFCLCLCHRSAVCFSTASLVTLCMHHLSPRAQAPLLIASNPRFSELNWKLSILLKTKTYEYQSLCTGRFSCSGRMQMSKHWCRDPAAALCITPWFSLQELNFSLLQLYKCMTQQICKILLLKNQRWHLQKACLHAPRHTFSPTPLLFTVCDNRDYSLLEECGIVDIKKRKQQEQKTGLCFAWTAQAFLISCLRCLICTKHLNLSNIKKVRRVTLMLQSTCLTWLVQNLLVIIELCKRGLDPLMLLPSLGFLSPFFYEKQNCLLRGSN